MITAELVLLVFTTYGTVASRLNIETPSSA
jgi:hypothetical protein